MLIEKNYDIGKCIAPKRCDVWGTCFFCLPEEQILQLQRYLTSQMQTLAGAASLSEAAGPIFQSNFMDFVRIYLAGISLRITVVGAVFIFERFFSGVFCLFSGNPFAVAIAQPFVVFSCFIGSHCLQLPV